MTLLPFAIPEGLVATQMGTGLAPWGSPLLMTVEGHRSSGEPVFAVVMDWPSPCGGERALEKEAQERLHVDHWLRTLPGSPIASRGSDPPDFVVAGGFGSFGLECTTWAVPGRRSVEALFSSLRKALLADRSKTYPGIAGMMVWMWFEDRTGAGMAKPHSRRERVALNELLKALAGYRPDPTQLFVPGGELPINAPALADASTEYGCRFYATPFLNAMPVTSLAEAHGFELALSFPSFISLSTIVAGVERAIVKHDSPGVDVLLMTAGGPDRGGLCFLAEEALADFACRHPIRFAYSPKHVKQVLVQSWSTGKVTQVWPVQASVSRPLFGGRVPEHRVFPEAPSSTSPPPGA